MGAKTADFSGYATKAGLKCSDGRTITSDAFKHQDKVTVPLVWQHGHNSPDNVLGHAVLEHRADGMYCYAYFNDTKAAQQAKELVKHGDIKNLSIYANQLKEQAKKVLHGSIKEVSLVLSGANPGALIDNITIAHGDGEFEDLEDEALIFTDSELEHEDENDDDLEHADGMTLQDVLDSLDEEQMNVVKYLIGAAMESAGQSASAQHSGTEGTPADGATADGTTPEGEALTHEEGSTTVTKRIFEQNGTTAATGEGVTLTHDDMRGILKSALENKSTFQAELKAYALAHGIDNIDVLFPEVRNIRDTPDLKKRRTEWVDRVLSGTSKTPFSRIKTMMADLTQEAARAKGYTKGNLKKEEWFAVSKRTTGPTTIYKKQKLDRDDIIDITDFDVAAWLQAEMRVMFLEELARAILLGDGRDVDDPDHVADPLGAASGNGIRSILNDDPLYVNHLTVNIGDASSSYEEVIEAIIRARHLWKGTGTPTLFTTTQVLTEMLLVKDGMNRRMYANKAELVSTLMVDDIVPVEVMEDTVAYPNLLGILVNLADYNVGTDKGGELNFFDFFDIDYNQMKYLYEGRASGALTRYQSAQVIHTTTSTDVLVDPVTAPTFVPATGVITIPTQTHVTYKNAADDSTLSAGAQAALAAGASMTVYAVAASGYFFSTDQRWTFTRPSA